MSGEGNDLIDPGDLLRCPKCRQVYVVADDTPADQYVIEDFICRTCSTDKANQLLERKPELKPQFRDKTLPDYKVCPRCRGMGSHSGGTCPKCGGAGQLYPWD